MAMWQLGMWSSLLIVLLSCTNTSAQLRKINYDPDEPFNVTLSKGLHDCSMESKFPLLLQRACSAMEVIAIKPQVWLCCTLSTQCDPCLRVQLELRVTDEEEDDDDDEDGDDGVEASASGEDGEEHPSAKETSKDGAASLQLCYTIPNTLPRCYEVKCARKAKRQPSSQPELIGVVLKSESFMPGVIVHMTAEAIRKVNATITIPLIDTICAGSQRSDVKCCAGPPRVSTKVDWMKREVQISAGNTTAQVAMCLKSNGRDGICKPFSEAATNIPLHLVTSCTCVQAWWVEPGAPRSESCPFNHTNGTALEELRQVLHGNVLDNLTTSVRLSHTHSGVMALIWNVSAPCRVSLDVHLCNMGPAWLCHSMKGNTRHIYEKDWRLENGSWIVSGAFGNISSRQPLCIKMKVMGEDIGPFCQHFSRRGRWIIPTVTVMLMFILMIFGLYSQKDTVEKWIQKWHNTSLLQGAMGHVLLLHAPCEDASLTEMVCLLGSTLKSLGFSVSLDLWSHTELGSLGPVPWLYSQMDQLQSTGGHALVVLSGTALERAEEWSRQAGRGGRVGDRDGDGGPVPPSSSSSPPTDVFSVALRCLLGDCQGGKEAPRHCFSLVQFDSHSPFAQGEGARSLPGLFQGLVMYSLPTESRLFLDTLRKHGGETARSWRWQSRWQSSLLSRTLMKSQLAPGGHLASAETVPLQP